mmetsp:Transcript_28005/g.74067  ORF Transcript_28005/g.74067 Transcript_28005/m.74067 type:complete len:313 (-) Transcript_28005:734-1672(-)
MYVVRNKQPPPFSFVAPSPGATGRSARPGWRTWFVFVEAATGGASNALSDERVRAEHRLEVRVWYHLEGAILQRRCCVSTCAAAIDARRAEHVGLVVDLGWQQPAVSGAVRHLDGARVDEVKGVCRVALLEEHLALAEPPDGALLPLGRHRDDGAQPPALPLRRHALKDLGHLRLDRKVRLKRVLPQDAHLAATIICAAHRRIAVRAPLQQRRLAKVVARRQLGEHPRLARLGRVLDGAAALSQQVDRRRHAPLLKRRLVWLEVAHACPPQQAIKLERRELGGRARALLHLRLHLWLAGRGRVLQCLRHLAP